MTGVHQLAEGARRGAVQLARATHLERPARERVLPLVRGARTRVLRADTSDDQVLRAVEAELRHAADSGEQVLVGPWLSELGFEVLYWVPFLRWAQEAFELDPARLTAVSRGGVSSWYSGVCDQYLEIFDAYSPDEFRQLTLARWQRAGGQKQVEVSAYDRQVLRRLTGQRSRGVPRCLHPWLMYRLFRLYWREAAPAARILGHARFRPFARPEYPEVEQRLPTEDFVAAKFYFRPSFPDTPENRRMIAGLLRGVAGDRPVVLLNTGLDLDDHDEWRADGEHAMTPVLDGVPPSRNLEAQSVAISRSSLFIGTYGGLSYLAPAYGVPSVAFYSEPAHFLRPHLDMARRAASATESAIVPVDARDPSALAGLDPEALKAPAG